MRQSAWRIVPIPNHNEGEEEKGVLSRNYSLPGILGEHPI